MSLNYLAEIKNKSETLVCEDFLFWDNVAPKWSIDLVLEESFKWYEKALLSETRNEWLNNYNTYLLEQKAINKLSKDVLKRLQLKGWYFDHTLLEYEKFIFIYSIENDLYSKSELDSIVNKEPSEYLEHLLKIYWSSNQKDLIDILRWLSEQKTVNAVHTNWEIERVIDDYYNPHFVCLEHH